MHWQFVECESRVLMLLWLKDERRDKRQLRRGDDDGERRCEEAHYFHRARTVHSCASTLLGILY